MITIFIRILVDLVFKGCVAYLFYETTLWASRRWSLEKVVAFLLALYAFSVVGLL